MSNRFYMALAALLTVMMLMLSGCGEEVPSVTDPPATEKPTQGPTETPTQPPEYMIRFLVGENVFSAMSLEEGQSLEAPVPQLEGMRFGGWLDESGNIVDLTGARVTGDATYRAAMYPDLSLDVPYLQLDEAGCLGPEEALTGDALAHAMTALTVEAARELLPQLPAGEDPVTPDDLRALLCQLFDPDQVERLNLPDPAVSRRQFAVAMNALLQRGGRQSFAIAADGVIPGDISVNDADFGAMMEAAVAHGHEAGAATWLEALVEMPHEPGPMNLGGWLYYAGEDGKVIRDDYVGDLYFGPDGRYTCGDPELDGIVAGILDEILVNNPGAERIDLLRRGFEYSRDSFKYLRRYGYGFGETGWEVRDAVTMFTTGRGNCYNFAASFWALARGLGYEAWAISGTMTSTDQHHGWVEIYFDGIPYIFDPEMEYVYIYERDIHSWDMFMVTYAAGTYWNYKRY